MSRLEAKEKEFRDSIRENTRNVHAAYEKCYDYFREHLDLSAYSDSAVETYFREYDASKYGKEEFNAYRRKEFPYYEGEDKEPAVREAYRYAVLHHYQNNPHHAEHWCYYEESVGGMMVLRMPDIHIMGMICDWLAENKLNTEKALRWYKRNGQKYPMHPDTREKVDEIMEGLAATYGD